MKPGLIQLLCFTIFLWLSNIIVAQDVDEIIAKHIAAHGGQEAWDKVEALKITGNFTAFSLEKDYTSLKTKEGLYYGDFNLGEVNVIEGFDGKTGWTIDPWQEMDYARNLNAGELNAFFQKAEFFTPFFNYKEKGHTVEYKGKETLEGIEVYVLNLTRANGKVETWYLDAETHLEFICKSDWVDFARIMPSEVFFDDFRDVDGLILPFFSERTFWQRDRILQIEEVKINPEIDDGIFNMPRREEISKLEFLEGNWDVKIEAWTQRGTWYPLGNTSSTIQFVSINKLQENISYERIYPISKIFSYTYNEPTANYRISVFNDLSSSFRVFEGEFSDTSFVFDDTGISFGGPPDEGFQYIRYSIHSMEKDGFVMERKGSVDKGETWSAMDRFTYMRREE